MSGERLKTALKGATKALLALDPTITGHCGTRIHDAAIPVVQKKGSVGAGYPQITFQVHWANAGHRLPAASFDLRINIWVSTHRGAPKTTIDTLELAVFDLLHGEVGETGATNLNAQAFTVRCRSCLLATSISIPEPESNLLHTSMTFSVILGTA